MIDWDGFFTAVRRITKNDLRPYVTRLARASGDYGDKRAFKVLVATVVSLRTRDKTCEAASERLFKLADTPQKIVRLSLAKIANALRPAAFYNTKARQLQKTAEILLQQYGGCVPKTLEELTALPGVGRKTANLVLVEGFHQMGICVDTHVHRILNELGFVKTKSPDATEMVLREILPKKYWPQINCQLVMLGMFHCPPGRALTSECLQLKRFASKGI